MVAKHASSFVVFGIFCCLLVLGSTLLVGLSVQSYLLRPAAASHKARQRVQSHAVARKEVVYAPPTRDLMHLWHESALPVWRAWKPNGLVRVWTHEVAAELFRLRFPLLHHTAHERGLDDETMKMLGALAVSHTHGGWVSYDGAPPPKPTQAGPKAPLLVDWPCRHPLRMAPAQSVVEGSLWYAPAYHPWVLDGMNCLVYGTCSAPRKALSETMYLASGGLRPRVGTHATWEETMRRKQEGLASAPA